MGRTYDSLQAFYPYYLSQHRNCICRLCHVLGSTSVLAILVLAIVLQNHWLG